MREQLLQSGASQFKDVMAKAIAVEAAKATTITIGTISTTIKLHNHQKHNNHKEKFTKGNWAYMAYVYGMVKAIILLKNITRIRAKKVYCKQQKRSHR